MQLILGSKCVDSLESVMQIADGEMVSAEECSQDRSAAPQRVSSKMHGIRTWTGAALRCHS